MHEKEKEKERVFRAQRERSIWCHTNGPTPKRRAENKSAKRKRDKEKCHLAIGPNYIWFVVNKLTSKSSGSICHQFVKRNNFTVPCVNQHHMSSRAKYKLGRVEEGEKKKTNQKLVENENFMTFTSFRLCSLSLSHIRAGCNFGPLEWRLNFKIFLNLNSN